MASSLFLRNLQDEECQIKHPDNAGALNLETSNIATKTEMYAKYSGFKNHIINGNFDIWQRGTSQATSEYGSDDRWNNSNVGSTKTHSRQTCTDIERALFNAQYYSRTVVSSVPGTSNQAVKFQAIEDVTKLAGKTVTLSFWAKADSTKNIAIEFGQLFGSGGTPSEVVLGNNVTTFTLTSTWQKFTKTLTFPSIVGKTLGTDGVHTSDSRVHFWFESGSNYSARTNSLGQQSGTFDIAQVQLEEGSVATPFEQRPIGLELSLCQRYYELLNGVFIGYVASANFTYFPLKFFVKKRVSPTISFIAIEAYWNSSGSIAGAVPYVTNQSGNGNSDGTMLFTSNPSNNTVGYAVSMSLNGLNATASAEL